MCPSLTHNICILSCPLSQKVSLKERVFSSPRSSGTKGKGSPQHGGSVQRWKLDRQTDRKQGNLFIISVCAEQFPLAVLEWDLEFLEVRGAQGESRPCDGPPAWSPVWRRVPAKFPRAGALENAAEPDRPSGSEELPPAKILKVRRQPNQSQRPSA